MKYIVAVSGGVDSVVLLDVLVQAAEHEIVVVHVNHGIRADSSVDEKLVRSLAEKHSLQCEVVRLSLGKGVSEETARDARHAALRHALEKFAADKIVTAHHEDDLLETMCINILRGTGWRGLCSLRNTDEYERPLLAWSKFKVVTYALEQNLEWHEDSTNDDMRYLRNFLRAGLVARLTALQRAELVALSAASSQLRGDIEAQASDFVALHEEEGGLSRYALIMLEQNEAYEVLRGWLGESLTRDRFGDLWLFCKTASAGSRWSLDATRFIRASQRTLVVESPHN